MRVYLQPPQPSRGLQRIADALARYAPYGVQVVDREADLTVIYAIGRRDHIERQCREILDRQDMYAVVQVCLRSTMSPDTRDWAFIWKKAAVVWSYYDLQHAAEADEKGGGAVFSRLVNFLHAPLGVDSQVFHDKFVSSRWATMPHQGRNYVITTSGVSRLQESVRECWLAAQVVGGEVFHVGGRASWFNGEGIRFSDGCDDKELALHYAASRFVSGLRRTEGFELPAAEGLLCGARPIVFDTPDYRWNYREFAEYIHEGTRAEVVDQLVQLFRQGARPVDAHELEEARHWFNWERVCGEFWNRCLQ